MRVCPFCTTENEAFFRFCIVCGGELPEETEAQDGKEARVDHQAPTKPTSKPPAVEPRSARTQKDTQVDLPPPTSAAPKPSGPTAPLGNDRPPRLASARDKTFDGGLQAKTASPAQQAVADAQLELAKKQAVLQKSADLQTKKAGASPELASLVPSAPKRTAPERPATDTPGKPLLRPERTALSGSTDLTPGRARLVVILEGGADGASIDLLPGRTILGRSGADISFPNDDFLAPRHAEFFFEDGVLYLSPLPSTNGVFLQVIGETELESGDVFRVGQQLLSFEILSVVASNLEPDPRGQAIPLGSPIPEGAWGRLSQLVTPELTGSVYLLGGSEVYLGRERGDITFPGDGFVSGLHAQISHRNGRCFLKDLGSSNGSYMRIKQPMAIRRGTLLLAGQQLFRIDQD